MRINIAVKLSGVFTLVCLSLLVLVALTASVMTTKGIKGEASKRLDNDVAVTLHTFDYFAQDALAQARMVAGNPRAVGYVLSNGTSEPAAIEDLLNMLPAQRIVRLFDASGRPLRSQGLPPEATDLVSAGVHLALAGEAVSGVEPIGDRGLAIRGIAPMRADGKIVGAVMVGSWLDQTFVDQIKGITGLEVGIAGGNSRVSHWLAQTIQVDSSRRLIGEVPLDVVHQVRGSAEVLKRNTTFHGNDYLAAWAPLFGDYGEFVGLLFIGEPLAPLQSMVRQSQILIFGLALLGAILASVVATLLSKTITNPIRVLAEQTSKISRGELDGRVSINSGDELEQLAQAFNRMSESLAIMKLNDQNCNPLTKLPGNLTIEREVQQRLDREEKIAVLYLDLDHFKAFNDRFGFEQGDRVIHLTAQAIQQAVQVLDNPNDFVGHIGGDDFIVLTDPQHAERLSEEIIRIFDSEVPLLYPPEDRERGYITSVDRRGQVQNFPLCSLSIAIVSNDQRPIRDFLELSSLASEVKKYAKSLEGSAFARDRRADRTAPLDPSVLAV